MPLHDWSRIPAGLFHDFDQTWAIQIKQRGRKSSVSVLCHENVLLESQEP